MRVIQFFDPEQDLTIAWKSLPHWAQAGTVCFITWRTVDSLPTAAQQRITEERASLLQRFDLDPHGDWKREITRLPARDRGRMQWSLFTAWDQQLDHGAGACVLARPELSQIVEESLLHFDGDRYVLTDAVVMPNHVHLLAAFRDEGMLISQCTLWKRYTGRRINAALGIGGEFWQVEQFDHLVRSPEQFEHYRRYIADNPRKAGLAAGTYRWYTKTMG
ncbi:MAG: hypothetical protein WD894_13225 [Pirellulales bacterium]